jgi:NAD(P)H-dependent FMN reductase
MVGKHGTTVTRLDLGDYKLPIYDPDLEEDEGLHDAALRLHKQFRSHRGIFIASPEYNANLSPLLLNVLTWVSRVSEDGGTEAAFGLPVFALGSASPVPSGATAGLWFSASH